MPRLPRLHAPGAVYHVTARGNHRNDIFFKHADRQLLDDIMAHALERTGARIHAYCWMTNHLHLRVQGAAPPQQKRICAVPSNGAICRYCFEMKSCNLANLTRMVPEIRWMPTN